MTAAFFQPLLGLIKSYWGIDLVFHFSGRDDVRGRVIPCGESCKKIRSTINPKTKTIIPLRREILSSRPCAKANWNLPQGRMTLAERLLFSVISQRKYQLAPVATGSRGILNFESTGSVLKPVSFVGSTT
jgi:hypothetical protein